MAGRRGEVEARPRSRRGRGGWWLGLGLGFRVQRSSQGFQGQGFQGLGYRDSVCDRGLPFKIVIEVKIEPLGIENRKIECHMSFLKLLQNTCSKLIGTLRRKMSFFCTILVIVLDNFSYKICRVARGSARLVVKSIVVCIRKDTSFRQFQLKNSPSRARAAARAW